MEFVARGKSDLREVLSNPRIKDWMATPDVSFRLMDKDGNYLMVSAGTEHVLGHTANEYIQLNAKDLVHPEDVPVYRGALAALKDGPVEVIMRTIHKEGHTIWAHAQAMQFGEFIAATTWKTDDPHDGITSRWRHIDPFL